MLPIVLLFYSFLLFPIEVKVVVGGLNLYAFRIAIIIGLPFLVYLAPKTTGRAASVDMLVAIGCVWMVLSFMSLYGIAQGGVRSLAIVLDTFGAYLIARGSISNLNDLRRVLILILPGIVFAAFFFVVESMSRQLFIRPFYTSIFGSAVNYEGGVAKGSLNLLYEIRLGLRRAYSVFSFPILGGVILGGLLPVYLMSGLKRRALLAGVFACSAAFFSLSSATFLVLALGAGMVLFDRLLPVLRPLRWPLLAAVIAFYGVLAEIALQGGIVGVISRFTLNPATAYIRRLQWRYGSETVMDNPLFGIGFAVYEKPAWLTDAIDAHFLAMALRHGLVTPALFAIALLIVMFSLGRNATFLARADRNLVVGLNIMLTVLIFISMTVTFFSEANVFFMIALGIATSCMIAISRARVGQPMMPGQMMPKQMVRGANPQIAPQTPNPR
ncbi:hypothetical protein EH31_16850 [Erythrobacter longus]|uniref:Uncharacterized protein n=1 Tax=Erythrobacter longus TaxID=1044 RepID=A0A074M5Q4_ERYLO|nr:hypothetical protein EH31_16850 [Erythrobacter longus]